MSGALNGMPEVPCVVLVPRDSAQINRDCQTAPPGERISVGASRAKGTNAAPGHAVTRDAELIVPCHGTSPDVRRHTLREPWQRATNRRHTSSIEAHVATDRRTNVPHWASPSATLRAIPTKAFGGGAGGERASGGTAFVRGGGADGRPVESDRRAFRQWTLGPLPGRTRQARGRGGADSSRALRAARRGIGDYD